MKKPNTLPVLLKNPKILLIGAGKVASDKAKVLIDNNINFDVISCNVSDEIKSLGISFNQKEISKEDLSNYNIIIDATGNPAVIDLIEQAKKERYILVNCVDKPEHCNFYFSSLLRYKNLKIAVSSDGASPAMTQIVRDKIKEFIPKEIGELAEKKALERNNKIINAAATKEETNGLFGKVYLIGCGPGDPDLLTIKAYNIIKKADVLLYDYLISPEILEIASPAAEKIYVGKTRATAATSQEYINNKMLELSKKGLTVARLKSGDPYIFGRGAEEACFLLQNNVRVEVIPGISSAIAGPLAAGIPPTARGYSSNVSIISGMLKDGKLNLDWIDLLNRENHTVILLMGLNYITDIVSIALQKGIDKNIPSAIVSNATRENQDVRICTFDKLPEAAITAESPAVIVFGKVVELSKHLPEYKPVQCDGTQITQD